MVSVFLGFGALGILHGLLLSPLIPALVEPLTLIVFALTLVGIVFIFFSVFQKFKKAQVRSRLWKSLIVSGIGLIVMAFSLVLLAAENLFPSTLAKKIEIGGNVFYVMDDSFLDPACSVHQQRYLLWMSRITHTTSGCIPNAVKITPVSESQVRIEKENGESIVKIYAAR